MDFACEDYSIQREDTVAQSDLRVWDTVLTVIICAMLEVQVHPFVIGRHQQFDLPPTCRGQVNYLNLNEIFPQ